jgi:hypothetical protein
VWNVTATTKCRCNADARYSWVSIKDYSPSLVIMNQAMDVFSIAGFHESPLLFVEWTDQQLVGMSKASAVSTKSVFK